MTYPVDDLGNPRVDFVWGQFPLQPNDQRDTYDDDNQTTDGIWTNYPTVGSANLSSGWTELSFGTGDGGNTRYQTFTWDSHTIATTGYNNFPEFLPNYAGDGDAGLEAVVPKIVGLTYPAAGPIITAAGFVDSGSTTTWVGATVANDGLIKTQSPAAGSIANVGLAISIIRYNAPEVPNLVGLTEAAATTALTNVHLVKGAVTTADNAAGATALNDGKIKTQSIAEGTTVDTGSSVALVKYAYVGVSTTGPIAGFNRSSTHFSLNGNQSVMYVVGRTVKPTVGDTISVTGSDNASHNVSWTVEDIVNDDAYNTGGTAVKVTLVEDGGYIDSNTATGGTWTKL
jgi:plastocyanin